MEGGLEPDNLKGLPPRHRWHRNKIQGLSTTPRAPFVAAPTIRLAFAAGTARVISVTFLPAAHLVSSPSDVESTTRASRHKTSVLGLALNVFALAKLGDSPAPAGPGDSADSLDPADSFVSRGGASPITSTCAPGTASCAPTSTGTCTSRSLAARLAAIAALVIEAVSTVPFSSSIAAREPMTSEPAMPSAGRALDGIERVARSSAVMTSPAPTVRAMTSTSWPVSAPGRSTLRARAAAAPRHRAITR